MEDVSEKNKTNIEVIKNENELIQTLKKRGTAHAYYKFYAPEYKIKYMIKTKALYLSNGNSWNDIKDRENMRKNSFAMCFSCSKFESVAMWMLYGGIDKKGALINFSKDLMNKICDSVENISFGYFEDKQFVEVPIAKDEFKNEFNVYLVDIGYRGNNTIFTLGGKIKFEKDEKLEEKLKYTKSYPWKYERECRLMVSTQPKEKNFFASNRIDTVKIKLSDEHLEEIKKRIFLSPTHPDKKTKRKEYTINLSKIDRQIDWDLCKDSCEYKQKVK